MELEVYSHELWKGALLRRFSLKYPEPSQNLFWKPIISSFSKVTSWKKSLRNYRGGDIFRKALGLRLNWKKSSSRVFSRNVEKFLKVSIYFEHRCVIGSRAGFEPSWHLIVQSQQWKQPNNVSNLFKVNNKVPRTTPITSFWCLCC